MLLIFHAATNRYEGEHLTMSVALFEDAVATLVEGGMTDGQARAYLIDEAEWSEDIAGVERLGEWARCLHCRRRLAPGRRQFCDVVCEAALYAAAPGD